jgi:hypothetical protein
LLRSREAIDIVLLSQSLAVFKPSGKTSLRPSRVDWPGWDTSLSGEQVVSGLRAPHRCAHACRALAFAITRHRAALYCPTKPKIFEHR